MKMFHGVCMTFALFVLASHGTAQEKGPRVVTKILKVDLVEQQSEPPSLVVTATGQVPTGGYSNVKLLRAVYATAPNDGIQDYFLLAERPDGIAAQVVSKVKASDTWKAYTKEAPGLKGIRVHGMAGGVVVKMIAGK